MRFPQSDKKIFAIFRAARFTGTEAVRLKRQMFADHIRTAVMNEAQSKHIFSVCRANQIVKRGSECHNTANVVKSVEHGALGCSALAAGFLRRCYEMWSALMDLKGSKVFNELITVYSYYTALISLPVELSSPCIKSIVGHIIEHDLT